MRLAPRKALYAAACGVGALIAQAVPASAEVWTDQDPTADVAKRPCDRNSATCWKEAPGNKTADMAEIRIAYRQASLTITLNVRAVDPNTDSLEVAHSLKVAKGKSYFLVMSDGENSPLSWFMYGPDGRDATCQGLYTSSDAKSDQISVTIPAPCLRRPDWVRWSAYVHVIKYGDDHGRGQVDYWDQFLLPSRTVLNGKREFSSKIFRGRR